MAKNEMTADERLSLRNRAKGELDRLSSVFNDPSTKQEIDNFKERFLICEVVYNYS